MAQQALPQNDEIKVKPIDPEVLRAQMLRPFPAPGFRAIAIMIAVILLLTWSLSGTQSNINTLLSGLPQVANFISRLFPPEFDLVRGTEVTFVNDAETRTVNRLSAIDTIAPLVRARELVHIETAERIIPIRTGNDLSVTVNSLRDQETITYLVGGSSITIGWPVVVNAIVETVQMAIIGTLGAVILSIPFALLAARNISPHPTIYRSTRFVLNILRSIPELIYALIFVAAVGLGPFPGVLALIFGSIGSLSRLFAEAIEQIDPQPVKAVQATGAGGVQTFMYAVIPQAMPLLLSYSIIYFEHNVRNATVLGLVGAGGVGFEINKYMSLFQYNRLLGTIVLLVITVTVIDRFSNYIRSRFI